MSKGDILIGWARGDITPQGRTLLQGQFHSRVARGTLSPLTATVLAMEATPTGGTADHVVFISCDLCYENYKADLIREIAARCPGLDVGKITANATHTHTGPVMRSGGYEEPRDDPEFITPDEYRRWLAARLADLVSDAWNGRKSGGISRGFGYAVVGRCRRAVYANGTALMYGPTDRPDFVGFESCDDHAVNMLFTWNGSGSLTGMIVNLACTSQCDEMLEVYSADFWHDVRESLAARFGTSVFLLPQCAPSGDMSPHLLIDKKEERDLRARIGVDAKGIIARRIMAAVEEGLATATPIERAVELRHEVRTFELPRVMVTDEQYLQEKRTLAMSEDERKNQPFEFQRIWGFGLISDLIARYERQAANPVHETESHIIRVGDAVFATNPFEMFVEYGARIRCKSRALQTFLVQLADGSAHAGYLPTRRARDGGHYSAVTKSNWVGPEGGDLLVDETVGVIDSLFETEGSMQE